MELLINRNQEKIMSAMPWVLNYQKKLKDLNKWWGKIVLIGKINSHDLDTMIFSDMNSTQEKLNGLQKNLIKSLLSEGVKKAVLDVTSKAQVAIDILIRNLFERTADVGFLSTDADIRSYLQKSSNTEDEKERLRDRLKEYVKKYSVYHDVIITDTNGNVQAQLDLTNPVYQTHDPLIKETINSHNDYLEIYRYTDLKPNKENSLIYSCKITESNNSGSRVLGVLCLFFKIEDEMEEIFNHLHVSDSNNLFMLTTEKGTPLFCNHCLASESYTFKPSVRPELVNIDNKNYISTTVNTKGYQGFYGLGWYGRSMLSLNDAFISCNSIADNNGKEYSELLPTSALFSDALKQIHHNSQDVNEDLKLIVLNGIITAARAQAEEFVPVLEEIKKIGDNTAAIFSESIQRLKNTVLSSRLTGVQFIAELAVDIMDRNLYERANDCRWWALTTCFRRTLGKGTLTDEDQQELTSILVYINQLYTVYTNIYLYNAEGVIVAVSDPAHRWMVGTYVHDDSGAKEVLRLHDSQKYVVSDFISSPYYQDKPTYIYNASVTELSMSSRVGEVIGGIGIVFDSEPQFKDMLTDTLPRNEYGDVIEGCFGVFIARNGSVISSTNYSPLEVGDTLNLSESDLFQIANGDSLARLLTYREIQYVVGVSASQGYREYKTTGDYSNDVLAVIFLPV